MEEGIEAKERILSAMVALLLEKNDVSRITTRQIAEMANVNSALINYYFQSKENLLNKAVEVCMETIASGMFDDSAQSEGPVIRLKNMIKTISSFAFNNSYLSQIAIASDLKQGSLNTSAMILPLLKEIFGGAKSEVELKLMALQLIAPLQVIFLNAKAYKSYFQRDIWDETKRNEMLDLMVNNLLNAEKI